MKANELRIGNWVKRKSQPDGFQIDSQSFHICERHPKWYTPIPLTEEWLIKFGFEKSGSPYWYDFGKGDKYITIRADFERGIFSVYNDPTGEPENLLCKIKYVHQLQNLYFALTQTELEVK